MNTACFTAQRHNRQGACCVSGRPERHSFVDATAAIRSRNFAAGLRNNPIKAIASTSHVLIPAVLHSTLGGLEADVAAGFQNSCLPIASASMSMFQFNNNLDSVVEQQLIGVSPITYAIVLAAGLASSLSPCTLSVLPLTIGYIGGYSKDPSGPPPVAKAASFAFGLATTLALLGVVSTTLGSAYGQTGDTLPIIVGGVAIAMGLNLLGVLQFQLPSVDLDTRQLAVPPLLKAYLAGLTFALAASPCSTPILATLLAYTSTQETPFLGGSLLLAYTCGYVTPLLIAASATGAMQKILTLRQYSTWITPTSGAMLLAGGTYTLLSRLA